MNENKTLPLIIGHQGAFDVARENTLKGFRKAIELGADYIEFDVHQSQDGALVVIHKIDIFQRMSKKSSISQLTLQELRKLDVGDGERIPELQEVIDIAKGKINLLCELKAKGISDKVVSLLKEENLIDSTIIQSFYLQELLEVRRIDPKIELAAIVPITEEFIPEWDKRKKLIQDVIKLKFPYIVSRHKNIDEEFLNYSHQHNLKVFAYTVTTKKIMKRMIRMNIDGLIVNSISKIKEILKHRLSD